MKLVRQLPTPLFLAISLLLSACANPRLGVQSQPLGAEIHMDGRPAGTTPLAFEPAYYGMVLLHGEEQVGEARLSLERQTFYGARSELVDFSAPVTPWLFGIDLIGEALVRVFGSMDVEASLKLPLLEPESGTGLDQLVEESEAASLAR